MHDFLDFARSCENLIKMALPPRYIVLSPVLSYGSPVKNKLNTPSHTSSRFCLTLPNRFQASQNMLQVDVVYAHLTNLRIDVGT